ncbi:MAG: hypothetical protein GX971_08910 [Firmicutes bacterium]|nr:hypothetical protein [Bacillota bacterium]
MLQITTTYPSFQVEYHWPRAQIEQQVSRVQITTHGPEMEIDQLQCRNELGIGGFEYFSRQVRDNAYHKVIESIGKMAAEGDEVLQRAGHFREEMIFADQARRKMDARIPELNIRSAPTTRPRIRFNYSQEINWNQGGVTIQHQVRPPTITWTLGGVHVDVRG